MVDSSAQLCDIFSALADPTRCQIVQVLARCGPQPIIDLAQPFKMSLQAVSKHIAVLAGAGLVRRTRVGRSRVCSLDARCLADASAWIENCRSLWESNLDRLDPFLAGEPDA